MTNKQSIKRQVSESIGNDSKITHATVQPKHFYSKAWFVLLTFIVVEPLGAILWFKFFKRPHAIVKFIVSFLWFFVWLIYFVGILMAVSDYKPESTKMVAQNQSQATPVSEQIAKIGEVINESDFNFTVNSIKCGEKRISTSGYVYFYTDAQGQFCRLNVTVTNIGSSANSIDASTQYLYNTQKQRYTYDSSATSHAANYSYGNPLDDNINPGNSVTGDFVFDVPIEVAPATAELHTRANSRGIKINLH